MKEAVFEQICTFWGFCIEQITVRDVKELSRIDFIEKGHELEGKSIAGKILVFPKGKGSTVGSYVIYGLAKNKAAPLAIIKALAV